MLFTTRSTNPFPLLLHLLTLLALDILHVVVLVSFHPRCCFYCWCPRFDSETAVLCRLSLLHLLLPSNCLIVWRTQFCFISVFFLFVFFAFHSLFALRSVSLSLAPFDSRKMKRQSARCDNRHTFEFYWLACHTSISHTHTLRKQQQWECQKRQTNRAEEGGKTKLLRDANGMAGWLVFWCHIKRSKMIPI